MPNNKHTLIINLKSPHANYQEHYYNEHYKNQLTRQYANLHPRFFANSACMQAKIDIPISKGQSLLNNAGHYLAILKSEHFIPENFVHHLPNHQQRDGQQYILSSDKLEKAGLTYILKAAFGPSFISFWFRNESGLENLEPTLSHACETMNQLYQRILQFNNHCSDDNYQPELLQLIGMQTKTA